MTIQSLYRWSYIVKSHSKALESMGHYLSGNMGKIYINGYNNLEIAALTSKYNMPVSVYSKYIPILEENLKVKISKPYCSKWIWQETYDAN